MCFYDQWMTTNQGCQWKTGSLLTLWAIHWPEASWDNGKPPCPYARKQKFFLTTERMPSDAWSQLDGLWTKSPWWGNTTLTSCRNFWRMTMRNQYQTETPQSNHRWYLPHFGVYHPQKPHKIRVVFNSAAETNGMSLNKMVLSGPELTNSLLGILIRFHQNPVAFMMMKK